MNPQTASYRGQGVSPVQQPAERQGRMQALAGQGGPSTQESTGARVRAAAGAGRSRLLTRILAACCGGMFLDGYALSIIGVAMAGIVAQLDLSASMSWWVSAASLVGVFFGAALCGVVTDRIGRKKMFAWNLVAIVGACVLSVLVSTPWQLIALRFVIGAAVGADYPIATSLLTEFAPSKKRGAVIGLSAVAWSTGAASAYLVGALTEHLSGSTTHWRWLLASSAIVGMAILVLRRGIPESPRWLIRNGHTAEAEAIVTEIYGDVDLRFLDAELDSDITPKVGLSAFFKGAYVRWFIMCSALYLAVATPLYALLVFLPTILSGFSISGTGPMRLIVQTAIIGLIVAGSIPSLYLVEKWGRRRLTLVSLALMAIPLAGLWLWSDGPLWFIVGSFCFYAIVSGGPSILVWIYPNELFPTEVRASAVGFTTAISRLGAGVGIFLLPTSIITLGVGTTMLIGAALIAAAFIVCLVIAPETKGETLEQSSTSLVVSR